jgi:hypothetical protein
VTLQCSSSNHSSRVWQQSGAAVCEKAPDGCGQ